MSKRLLVGLGVRVERAQVGKRFTSRQRQGRPKAEGSAATMMKIRASGSAMPMTVWTRLGALAQRRRLMPWMYRRRRRQAR
eukprot:6083902-Pleurochrysis_carterae.AAC.1